MSSYNYALAALRFGAGYGLGYAIAQLALPDWSMLVGVAAGGYASYAYYQGQVDSGTDQMLMTAGYAGLLYSMPIAALGQYGSAAVGAVLGMYGMPMLQTQLYKLLA